MKWARSQSLLFEGTRVAESDENSRTTAVDRRPIFTTPASSDKDPSRVWRSGVVRRYNANDEYALMTVSSSSSQLVLRVMIGLLIGLPL